ncbi:MAG: CotH kinase family protein [Nanoarchaeota archaeon]|nr:CotH kinase family protein [Nanoarchaeota archaeon]
MEDFVQSEEKKVLKDLLGFLKRYKSKIQFILLLVILILAIYTTIFVFDQKDYDLVLKEKFLTFLYANNFLARQSNLPTYKILIPLTSLYNLESEMPEINYVLENPFSWQPATFEFEGKKYEVELKYRGVYDSHWRHEKKNMAIKFKEGNLFKNRRKLLLIIPEAMSMMPNGLNSYSAEVLGLPSPRTDFVQVEANGEYWGVYEDSENVDGYFLENHDLPHGDIFDIEVDADSFLLNKWANEDYDVHWNRLSVEADKNEKDTTRLAKLIHVINLESDEEFKKEIEKILDIDEYLHWAAHNYFPGTTRQSDHNVKLYYNPEIQKFWQIPWDLEGYSYNGHIDYSINVISNGLMDRILKFPDYNYRKNQIIWKYLNAELSAENQIKKLDELYDEVKYGIYRDPYKRATRKAVWYSNKDYDQSIEEMRQWILKRDENLRFQLEQSNVMIKLENQGFSENSSSYLRFRISTAWGVGAYVEELILPLISRSNEFIDFIGWELYSDNNRDGTLSDSDKLIIKGQAEHGKLRIKIDSLFFPDKSIHDPSQPVWKLEMFKDPISSFDYIIKLNFNPNQGAIAVGKDVGATSFNAVTAKPIDIAVSFVDEIYYDNKQIGESMSETGISFKDFLVNEEPQ